MLNNRVIILVVTIFISLSCSPRKEKLQIEQDKLKSILKDLHLAEEVIQRFRDYQKDSVRALYWNDISVIHEVDSIEIQHDLDVLKKQPKLALDIYSSIYDEVNEEYIQLEKSESNLNKKN